MPRPYTMKARATHVEDTRRRITEAAVALHGSIGPARTTISAIAERAGVERLTVYRHFPDEAAVLEACSRHWLAGHPPPDPSAWTGTAPPSARAAHALAALYAYFEENAAMLGNVLRDAAVVSALAAPVAGWTAYLETVAGSLEQGCGARGRARRFRRLAVSHAVQFETWASLARGGADRDEAVLLMAALIAEVTPATPRPGAATPASS